MCRSYNRPSVTLSIQTSCPLAWLACLALLAWLAWLACLACLAWLFGCLVCLVVARSSQFSLQVVARSSARQFGQSRFPCFAQAELPDLLSIVFCCLARHRSRSGLMFVCTDCVLRGVGELVAYDC